MCHNSARPPRIFTKFGSVERYQDQVDNYEAKMQRKLSSCEDVWLKFVLCIIVVFALSHALDRVQHSQLSARIKLTWKPLRISMLWLPIRADCRDKIDNSDAHTSWHVFYSWRLFVRVAHFRLRSGDIYIPWNKTMWWVDSQGLPERVERSFVTILCLEVEIRTYLYTHNHSGRLISPLEVQETQYSITLSMLSLLKSPLAVQETQYSITLSMLSLLKSPLAVQETQYSITLSMLSLLKSPLAVQGTQYSITLSMLSLLKSPLAVQETQYRITPWM